LLPEEGGEGTRILFGSSRCQLPKNYPNVTDESEAFGDLITATAFFTALSQILTHDFVTRETIKLFTAQDRLCRNL
jgi:hypothetical protein